MSNQDDSYDLLDQIETDGIFCLEKDGDCFVITEACDNHHSRRLTKEELLRLSDEIKTFALQDN